ncbi:MAG TPA: hypothetical protein VJY54_01825 [Lachnospiraceae bacterium]|nr:hypothetical protein [Lachnospiraceae bacterium]
MDRNILYNGYWRITPDTKTHYREYLIQKGKKYFFIDECMEFADIFAAVLADKPNVLDAIHVFIERINSRGLVVVKAAYQFLDDYAKFMEKEQPSLADAVRDGCQRIFEQTAINDVKEREQGILPIPADAKINPKHLGNLTNEQFITAFGELQQFVISCYKDIVKAPFEWGYPDFYSTGGYYNRVNDILFALAFCGEYQNGVLTVDGNKFFVYNGVKMHKKVELMVTGFEKMGMKFDSFNKKADTFCVTYPKNPLVLHALCSYVSEIDESKPHWSYGKPRNGFSYRFVECASAQTHETAFLAEFDYMPSALQEIQLWLYAEAAKSGFSIDSNEPLEKGCMLYKKGSKRWLLAGQPQFSWKKSNEIYVKTIFRKVLANDDIAEFYCRFPDTFQSNCRGCNGDKPCIMRIEFNIDGKPRRCCAYNSFLFKNPTLKDIKLILELFKLENKIK